MDLSIRRPRRPDPFTWDTSPSLFMSWGPTTAPGHRNRRIPLRLTNHIVRDAGHHPSIPVALSVCALPRRAFDEIGGNSPPPPHEYYRGKVLTSADVVLSPRGPRSPKSFPKALSCPGSVFHRPRARNRLPETESEKRPQSVFQTPDRMRLNTSVSLTEMARISGHCSPAPDSGARAWEPGDH